ncbi:MAG: hypothetical protein JWP08_993, partial [Bryobacterales bacterium]|nr:hypothetical protein [Bryobacterales bacterium]
QHGLILREKALVQTESGLVDGDNRPG